MDTPPIQVGLSEDKKSATITWSGPATLNAHELELLTEALGIVRKALAPAVPVAPPDPGARIPELSHIELRRTAIGSSIPVEVGAMFLVRSPMFGWLDCPMGPEFCQSLALWLQGKGDQLAAPSGSTLQ